MICCVEILGRKITWEGEIMKRFGFIIAVTCLLLTTSCASSNFPTENFQKKAGAKIEQTEKKLCQMTANIMARWLK